MAKSVNDGDTSTKNKSANSCMVFDGHDCRKDNHCKPKWDYLGCVHLYKITKVEERKTFLTIVLVDFLKLLPAVGW